jgi:hypothetical protein
MVVTFQIDADDFTAAAATLRSFADVADGALDGLLDDVGADAEAAVRARAARHHRTGALEGEIRRVRHGADVEIHVGGPIAPIIVGGSAPHVILPIRSRSLALVSRVGGPVERFAGRVRHPGTDPDPFVAEALDDTLDSIDRTIEHAGDRLIDELADAIT